MVMRLIWAATAAVAVVVAGCGEGAGEGPATNSVTSDSSGVQVVESTGPAWTGAGAWHLASSPRLEIGATDGDPAYLFSNVRAAFALPDGRLVVANVNNPPEVRAYSPGGDHLWTAGGAGDGPGELRFIVDVYEAADSLVVYDPFAARMTYLDLEGNVLKTERISGFQDSPGLPNLVLHGRFSDGSFLGRFNRGFTTGVFEDGRAMMPAFRVTATGELLDTLGVFPDADMGRVDGQPSSVLLGKRAVISAEDTLWAVGTAEAYQVDEYDLSGRLVRRFRKPHPPVPVTEEMVAVLREQALSGAAEQERPLVERRFSTRPVAEVLPAYSARFLVDWNGDFWVREYAPPGDGGESWSVFGPDRRFLGMVAVPDGTRITDVADDYVVGVRTDALDVPRVVVFDLLKGRAST